MSSSDVLCTGDPTDVEALPQSFAHADHVTIMLRDSCEDLGRIAAYHRHGLCKKVVTSRPDLRHFSQGLHNARKKVHQSLRQRGLTVVFLGRCDNYVKPVVPAKKNRHSTPHPASQRTQDDLTSCDIACPTRGAEHRVAGKDLDLAGQDGLHQAGGLFLDRADIHHQLPGTKIGGDLIQARRHCLHGDRKNDDPGTDILWVIDDVEATFPRAGADLNAAIIYGQRANGRQKPSQQFPECAEANDGDSRRGEGHEPDPE
jgi:hypothetical protein